MVMKRWLEMMDVSRNAVGLMDELFFSGEMIVNMMGQTENGG